MSLDAVQRLVFKRLADNPVNGLPVIFPNTNKELTDVDHLRVSVLSSPTVSLGVRTVVQERGFIQIDVMVRNGGGAIVASGHVSAVLALFPRHLELVDDSEKVRFDKEGWPAPAMSDGNFYKVPVNIPYVITR